ncbi:MAG: hypothetical protein R3183_02020 [Oleiphilaceae bacterium]|nr:hypothetical protein [Oleiphilaceae bacterium]
MHQRLHRLCKWLLRLPNYGVPAPQIFSSYELKLLSALAILAMTLLWALAERGAQEGVWGVALLGGLALYLSYSKYYLTYKPAMDRWAMMELVHPDHPREELRVADRDLLISEDEVRFIAARFGVKVVSHPSPDNPSIQIYESVQHYEHRLLANRTRESQRKRSL